MHAKYTLALFHHTDVPLFYSTFVRIDLLLYCALLLCIIEHVCSEWKWMRSHPEYGIKLDRLCVEMTKCLSLLLYSINMHVLWPYTGMHSKAMWSPNSSFVFFAFYSQGLGCWRPYEWDDDDDDEKEWQIARTDQKKYAFLLNTQSESETTNELKLYNNFHSQLVQFSAFVTFFRFLLLQLLLLLLLFRLPHCNLIPDLSCATTKLKRKAEPLRVFGAQWQWAIHNVLLFIFGLNKNHRSFLLCSLSPSLSPYLPPSLPLSHYFSVRILYICCFPRVQFDLSFAKRLAGFHIIRTIQIHIIIIMIIIKCHTRS